MFVDHLRNGYKMEILILFRNQIVLKKREYMKLKLRRQNGLVLVIRFLVASGGGHALTSLNFAIYIYIYIYI